MSPLLLLLIAAVPAAKPADPWVGAPPAGETIAPVRYDQQPTLANTAPAAAQARFNERVLALEIALSTIVAERPTLWRFDRLENEAAALLPKAPTDADRRAVRDIANRIDRFARIGARHRQERDNGGWSRTAITPPGAASRVAPPVRLTKAPSQRANQHDAQGILKPVVSKRAEAPKYAIVDDRGTVTTLVTPQPEVAKNFEKLVGKRVGLSGKRGFLTDLNRQHLIAERVTPLETVRR